MAHDISTHLSELRRERGLTQSHLASELTRRGFAVTNQAVSKWETGTAQPSAAQFLEICKILGIRDISAEFGVDGGLSDGLNSVGRKKLAEYADLLRASGLYDEVAPPVRRIIPLYTLAVSAGTGQFLDSSNYEEMLAGDDVPKEADYGVRVAGDSMEPIYRDGQTVWVKNQKTLSHGEIGIFLYDGSAYLKRLYCRGGQLKLVSENPAYKDIIIGSGEELLVLGKAVM